MPEPAAATAVLEPRDVTAALLSDHPNLRRACAAARATGDGSDTDTDARRDVT
jgi:hypothetical protein